MLHGLLSPSYSRGRRCLLVPARPFPLTSILNALCCPCVSPPPLPCVICPRNMPRLRGPPGTTCPLNSLSGRQQTLYSKLQPPMESCLWVTWWLGKLECRPLDIGASSCMAICFRFFLYSFSGSFLESYFLLFFIGHLSAITPTQGLSNHTLSPRYTRTAWCKAGRYRWLP